ncbi:MAG: formyl transferase [Magnetococcus sp. YQC-5]
MTAPDDRFSVMILCGTAPRHLYVANRLIRAGKVIGVVQEVGSRPTWKKFLRMLLHPSILLQKIWFSMRARRLKIREQEASFFFGTQSPVLEWNGVRLAAPHINHPEVVALAERLEPDLIVVFGTSLIREPLLSRARHAMINLHGGLSPHYRGADCTFWALANQEPEQVGCTLHFIDPGIDTGKLVAHVRPAVEPLDNENTLFWRAVREAAECLVELPSRMAQGERFGVIQTSKGRLYQVKERTLSAQRHLDHLLSQGMLRDLHLPRRIQWFYNDTLEQIAVDQMGDMVNKER